MAASSVATRWWSLKRFSAYSRCGDVIENSPDTLLDAVMGKEKIRYEDVEVQFTRTGIAAGSWKVTRLMARRFAATQVVKILSQLSATHVSNESTETIFAWLQNMRSNQAKAAHADVLVWALLGVEEAKADLLDWKTRAESTGHIDLARAFDEVVHKSRLLPKPFGV